VGVRHGSGGVGYRHHFGTRVVVFVALCNDVESHPPRLSQGCGPREEKHCLFHDPNPLTVCFRTIYPDCKAACCGLTVIPDPYSHAQWIARREATWVLAIHAHTGYR